MCPPDPAVSVLLLLVGSEANFRAGAREAARLAFPGREEIAAETFDEAVQKSADTRAPWRLLVLLQPTEDEKTRAAVATDATGLPRWAIVTCGQTAGSDAWRNIAPADWKAPLVARVFQAAIATHRLQRENARSRGDLTSIGTRVAHDLRSPLGGVLTTAEVLREVLADELPGKSRLVDPVIESTDELIKLIRQLSLFAKASGQASGLVRLDVGATFWSAFQKIEREVLAKKATVSHATAWPEVMGDPTWLEAIWHIFLGNALEHAGAAPRLEAGWDPVPTGGRFWLQDSGSVPLEKRGKLFQPFHLLHEPNAPRGLGLPIAQRLVELQGGQCGYEPVAEGGSRFYFVLPLAVADAGKKS